jgi:hypothetical protein
MKDLQEYNVLIIIISYICIIKINLLDLIIFFIQTILWQHNLIYIYISTTHQNFKKIYFNTNIHIQSPNMLLQKTYHSFLIF